MTKTKKESKEELLERAERRLLKEKADKLFRSAFDSRERYDTEWLTRDLFRRGYHFSSYDSRSKTALLATRSSVKFPINLVWQQMRSVKNQVTNFKPKWEVLPSGMNDEALQNADYSGRLLDYYYHRLKLRKMIKDTVIQGLIFSVGGPWQIGYDPAADNGLGEVYIWLLDPYDFYIDPHATSLDDAEYVVKAVRKNLNEIIANPKYEFLDGIPEHGDASLAASPSKQFLLQTIKTSGNAPAEEEEEGAILKEAWIKVHVTDENIEGLRKELAKNDEDAEDLDTGDVLMRIVHYVDFVADPLLVQLKRTSTLPFKLYTADINPCELYGESWIKHLIPVNRVLDALESSVFMYNHRYAVGRIVLDKNSGVRLISNQHGDFIEKNPGSEVSFPNLAPLPPSYSQQIENCRRYIEDLGGSHEVSRGIVPAGVKSGIGISELKQADSTNSSDLVDNLEDFLEQVGKEILKVIAENYSAPKAIKDLGLGGDVKHFAVVGEKGAKRRKNAKTVKMGADNFDLAVIGSDNEIRVTIGSWLAYTKSAQQERLIEMFNAGLIDQPTVLKYLEFPDINAIVTGVRKEEVLKKYRGAPSKDSTEVSDEEIARQENMMMTDENRDVEPEITDNHVVHNIVHQEALGLNGNARIEKHMALHDELMEKSPQRPAEGPVNEGTVPAFPEEQTAVPTAPQQGSPEEAMLEQSLAEMV